MHKTSKDATISIGKRSLGRPVASSVSSPQPCYECFSGNIVLIAQPSSTLILRALPPNEQEMQHCFGTWTKLISALVSTGVLTGSNLRSSASGIPGEGTSKKCDPDMKDVSCVGAVEHEVSIIFRFHFAVSFS